MTQIPLSIELHFLRIPTLWVREGENGALPQIDRKGQPVLIERDWEVRDRFLRLKKDPEETLDFLSSVGIWHTERDLINDWLTSKPFGEAIGDWAGRVLPERPLAVLFDEFWKEQELWLEFLRGATERRIREWASQPRGSIMRRFGHALRQSIIGSPELPLRIEFKRKTPPIGVVEVVTGAEVIIATTLLELMQGARFAVCARVDCGTPFAVKTAHDKKYCSWYCSHIETVRRSRRKNGKKR